MSLGSISLDSSNNVYILFIYTEYKSRNNFPHSNHTPITWLVTVWLLSVNSLLTEDYDQLRWVPKPRGPLL